LGVPSAKDMAALNARVEKLAAEVAKLSGKKAPAKKAPAKKAAAKTTARPAAKRAPRKAAAA